MKKGFFQDFLKPVLVLLVICLIVGVLLSYVNSVTSPIIEENNRVKAEQTRSAVLPDADGFEEIECDLETLGITGAYRATNGAGYVMTAQYKGYGGYVTVTAGLNPDGSVQNISADVSTETSGVGSKAGNEDYLAQFQGITGNSEEVDTISGATYSSTAVKASVDQILAAFETIREGE